MKSVRILPKVPKLLSKAPLDVSPTTPKSGLVPSAAMPPETTIRPLLWIPMPVGSSNFLDRSMVKIPSPPPKLESRVPSES